MIRYEVVDHVAWVTIDRPERRNAMTLAMYEQIVEACVRADATDGLRALVITGSGASFCAGTDVATFLDFDSGDAGVAYERRITDVIERIMAVTVPTVAVVRGPCIGGGLLIAAACDLRIADDTARFGAPVATTVGNTLSVASLDLLGDTIGEGWLQRMLVGLEVVPAAELVACGFVRVVAADDLDDDVERQLARLAAAVSSSLVATRKLLARRRSARMASPVNDIDVVRDVYASPQLRERVRRFLSR